MEPDELIQKLAALGQTVARATLPRWVRQGLIPAPKVRSLGRGQGAEAIYPSNALGEAYAAAVLLRERKATVREVAFVRSLYHRDLGLSDEVIAKLLQGHPAAEWDALTKYVREHFKEES